jgi:hypothetical protein
MALQHELLFEVVLVVPELFILHPEEFAQEVPVLSHFDLSHFDLLHFDISHFVSVVHFDLSQLLVSFFLQQVLGVASVFVTEVEVDVELLLCAETRFVVVRKIRVIETRAGIRNNLFMVYFLV